MGSREYYQKNKNIINAKHRANYEKNKEKIKAKQKKYYQENKEKINIRRRKYMRELLAKNPIYLLRQRISRAVRSAIKKQGQSKNKKSILNYLPYSIDELKKHLESLWEPWMNWNNYGSANINKRTWQIDHVIPQSALPYDSMEHPNFKKCWALENLKPIEAIENIKKSNKIF